MKAVRGRSGVIHAFTDVINDSGVEQVVEEFPCQIDELDILKFYCKILDFGASSAVIRALSWTKKAGELAREYGIRLEVKAARSGEIYGDIARQQVC